MQEPSASLLRVVAPLCEQKDVSLQAFCLGPAFRSTVGLLLMSSSCMLAAHQVLDQSQNFCCAMLTRLCVQGIASVAGAWSAACGSWSCSQALLLPFHHNPLGLSDARVSVSNPCQGCKCDMVCSWYSSPCEAVCIDQESEVREAGVWDNMIWVLAELTMPASRSAFRCISTAEVLISRPSMVPAWTIIRRYDRKILV